jgi:hypothetical protein
VRARHWTRGLYGRTVSHMAALSQVELNRVRAESAQAGASSVNVVVHWQSAFGLIVIEVRSGEVFVNGDWVEPACNFAESRAQDLV